MKHLRLFLATIALCVLAACAQVGPRTFDTYVADVLQTADAAVSTTRTLLRAGKISVGDAENVLKAAETARDGVAVARVTALQQGEAAGNSRLRLAADSLDQLNAYLATKGK